MGKPRAKQKQAVQHAGDEKKRKRRVVGFGIVMVVLMVASILGVANYAPGGEDLEYGDYAFRLETRANGGQVLVTEIDGVSVEFQNLPVQVSYLEVDPAAITILKEAQQIVLAADPDEEPQDAALIDYARLQLGLALGKTVNAITEAREGYALPVFTCAEASAQTPVVLFNLTNETGRISTEEYCITLSGRNQELMRVKDRAIFDYYGIGAGQ